MQKINILVIGAVVIIVTLFIVGNSLTFQIEPGEAGVMYKPLGNGIDRDNVHTDQGLHLKLPWNKVIKYNIKQQDLQETITALSSNGLTISLELTLWYRLIPNEIGYLHEEKGKLYESEYIIPAIRASGRTAIGKYIPEELYSTKKDAVIELITSETKKILEKRHIVLEEILIRDIKLPAGLSQSIEQKLQAEQATQRAREEAERLIIQAKADSTAKMIGATTAAAANRAINASLNDNLLKWKGIEATIKLSESPNSKVVVIGNSKNGLPLILGDK